VLITGESGTGKEVAARALHDHSPRAGKPFTALNISAIPEELLESELFGQEQGAFAGAYVQRRGRFEQANGGTLFLDEIGDMSANVQAKLLRALEERRIERLGGDESIPVDVRIVSATHRALEEEIADGNFRADLFYRLQVVTIDIPPLRERREDIPLLAEAFARRAAERHRLPERPIGREALKQLLGYDWPGNVRELRNAIERASIMSEGAALDALDLSEEPLSRPQIASVAVASNGSLQVPYTSDFRDDRREFERRYIARCLDEAGGNVTRAAAVLGMHRQSLQHKLRELGLGRRYVAVGSGAQEKEDR
jgi:DNA-binding NtrC family response regulator